ncbi:MAG: hypothetical protein EOO11_17665 [Chitinophagaceae bacterium]|nr:MAG: hypothetical protein EOO11_17665 [Chitinophagaceae bacterium]
MLDKINLRPLHNAEFLTFTDEFLKIFEGQQLPAQVTGACDALRVGYRKLFAAHVGEDESLLSRERREIDVARDEQYSGLRQIVTACLSNKIPEKRAAALRLDTRLKDYGTVRDVIEQGDADETTDIKGILRDLHEPGLAADITLIGGSDWVEELDRLQTLFDQKTTDRNNERGERRLDQPEDTDILRDKASTAFRKLCNKVNSFNETEEGADPWPGLIARGNALISNTRQLLKARKARAAAAKAESSTPEAS